MNASINLGRIAGVRVGIHWSWLVVFALFVWSLATVVFPEVTPDLDDATHVAMAIVAVIVFFASLLAHELGHARQAVREGMEIAGITLWLFGGVAQFRGRFPSAGAEFRIAIAGPLVTLVIGIVCLALAVALPLGAAVDAVVLWLGYTNLVILVFNLLPALPLDGGRVLRSALWARKRDFVAATRTAAAVGRWFAQGLIALGVLAFLLGGAVGGIWLVFIGWFVLAAAEAELVAAERQLALSGLSVADAMVSDPVTVPQDLPIDAFMRDVFERHRHVAYPVVDGNRPVGLISFRDALKLPRESWAEKRVADVMSPLDRLPAFTPDTGLDTALEGLVNSTSNRTVVLDSGSLVGLLSITDASRLFESRRARVDGHP